MHFNYGDVFYVYMCGFLGNIFSVGSFVRLLFRLSAVFYDGVLFLAFLKAELFSLSAMLIIDCVNPSIIFSMHCNKARFLLFLSLLQDL